MSEDDVVKNPAPDVDASHPERVDSVEPVEPIEPIEPNGEGGANGNGQGESWSLADLLLAQEGGVDVEAGEDDTEASYERPTRLIVDAVVLVACVAFVFLQLGPNNLLTDSTPAGGDMGAHVWAPAYLRDHLLPNFQVSGWTPDWYAGFPAYQFYMVIPPIVIVLLDWGVEGPLVVLPLAAAAGALAMAIRHWEQRRLRILLLVAVVGALLCISLPYGVAFKLVSVAGPLGLPVAAYAFGRLAGLRYPTPAVLAAATLPFLFYRGYSIYGGNIASTLAGEFSFAISLCLSLLYLGVVFRGFETGRGRWLAAVLLALAGLCHLIPVIWVLGATAVAVVVRPRRSTAQDTPCLALLVPGGVLAALGWLWLAEPHVKPLGIRFDGVVAYTQLFVFGDDGTAGPLAMVAVGGVLLLVGTWLASQTARWLTPAMVVAGLLAAWWVGPFYLRRTYMNDMGWEKVPYFSQGETWGKYLLPSSPAEHDLRWLFALALLGFGLSVALRLRIGMFLGAAAVVNGIVFWLLPQGRLWNARILPFYYLVVILLAGFAVAETVRLVAVVARRGRHLPAQVGGVAAVGSLAAVLVYVGLPLGALPFDQALGDEASPTGYRWPSFSPWRMESSPPSFVNSWADWNYSGYEGKPSYREYHDLMVTMRDLGQDGDHGCGRAFWEYEQELDRYGTPMALMLLPYWTDGCIGSMEGLYFESSSTTPYHFLMGAELSAAPSNPQRDLPYGTFDIEMGVRHMQLMGVRYYMAFSDQAVQAARSHPDLSQVAVSEPWVIFEVADSELVTPLEYEPAVLEGVTDNQHDWLDGEGDPTTGQANGPAVEWFMDPSRWDVALSQGGLDEWQRVDPGDTPQARSVTPAEVTNIDATRGGISFDVDRVGSPVLVKVSYFPNWRVEGAEGPWRVAPNLMLVVPTENHVELRYGRTSVEYVSYTATAMGLVGLVLLIRRGTYRYRSRS